jgi:MurNAc alpha-1-phosphate uridylyltransferase
VSYVDEGESLRGTAGALRAALDADVLEENFAVLYGDSYLPIDLAPVWRAFDSSRLPALMTVLRNDDRWDRSNVVYENGLVLLYEKHAAERDPQMAWIDYGLAVLERRLIGESVSPGTTADLADLYATLSRERRLAGFEVAQRFYEVGSAEGLGDLARFLKTHT